MRRTALPDVLKRLEDRNKDQDQPNGLFASHPLIKDRHRRTSRKRHQPTNKLAATATVAGRYTKTITFDAKPLADDPRHRGHARVDRRSSRRAVDSKDARQREDPKQAEPSQPKKKGGLLGKIGLTERLADHRTLRPSRRLGRADWVSRIATRRAAPTRARWSSSSTPPSSPSSKKASRNRRMGFYHSWHLIFGVVALTATFAISSADRQSAGPAEAEALAVPARRLRRPAHRRLAAGSRPAPRSTSS